MKNRFTDFFIEHPVIAVVISLLMLLLGAMSYFSLTVRQYPELTNTTIIISTIYPGADAKTVQGFITTPLEREIAGADGIDYITSSSQDNVSTITIFVRLNYNSDQAFTSVLSKVQKARQDLPNEAEEPTLVKRTGDRFGTMYLSFFSKVMTREQITNYLTRIVVPKLLTIPGLAQANILSGREYAMRIWLDSKKMAGFNVSAEEVRTALRNNNIQSQAGTTRNSFLRVSIKANTDLTTPEEFANIVIKKGKGDDVIRMKDIAEVKLGSINYDASAYFSGNPSVALEIRTAPTANILDVANHVRKEFPNIQKALPAGLEANIAFDFTRFVRSAIREVVSTIIEATIIVLIVIYFFLGSLRTVIIPIITIPLSLVGVLTFMFFLGYSINLLTLLAMVLAIGMVVDDAIVVLENIYRHVEEGLSAFDAAITGAREIATAVIAMTLTLAAVFAPIGFSTGLTGALFKEFAFTLASAVIVSGIIALTLTPMMCSKTLTADISKQKLVHIIDRAFTWLKNKYQLALADVLKFHVLTLIFTFFVLLSCVFLYQLSPKELAPTEDQGFVFTSASAPETATLEYLEKFNPSIIAIYNQIPDKEGYFLINGVPSSNTIISGLILKPWDERKQTQMQVNQFLQKAYQKIPELQIQAFPLPSLPTGGRDFPIQIELVSTLELNTMYPYVQQMVQAANQSGLFLFAGTNLRFDKPQYQLDINRDKAALLGVDINKIADSLSTSFSEGYVSRFATEGQSYKVIPQLLQNFRFNPEQINQLYVQTKSGDYIPLRTVADIKMIIEPNAYTHFQQLNSAEIFGAPRPGVTLSDLIKFFNDSAKKILPTDITIDYAGEARQYLAEGTSMIVMFAFSIALIYLFLAAQFQSFRDPLVILISVPTALCGALLAINWGLTTINIYTQIGLITLIGLISKHGILMVDFAKQLQQNQGLNRHDAILEAAAIRLRPILMTTFSMILAVVPLLIATGAGAASRFAIGIVIFMGLSLGTLFTLFVLPVIYITRTSRILFLVGLVAITALIINLLA